MTATETRGPIDMTSSSFATDYHDVIEIHWDDYTHWGDWCWCGGNDPSWTSGTAMRWLPTDPAPRFGPEGLR